MIDMRDAKRLLSRITAAARVILGSAGGDAMHGVHYGCDLPPHISEGSFAYFPALGPDVRFATRPTSACRCTPAEVERTRFG